MGDVIRMECNSCGGDAAFFPADTVPLDEEVTCPECGARYIINADVDGNDVWLTEVDNG